VLRTAFLIPLDISVDDITSFALNCPLNEITASARSPFAGKVTVPTLPLRVVAVIVIVLLSVFETELTVIPPGVVVVLVYCGIVCCYHYLYLA
jgi:hypothetical protein